MSDPAFEPPPEGPDPIVILCTVPADFDAEPLAANLVERSLAACVQTGLAVRSTYRWKGATEKSEERLVLIKTTRRRFAEVESAIRAVHPYDVPEIIALNVSAGHAPYLAWMAEGTAS